MWYFGAHCDFAVPCALCPRTCGILLRIRNFALCVLLPEELTCTQNIECCAFPTYTVWVKNIPLSCACRYNYCGHNHDLILQSTHLRDNVIPLSKATGTPCATLPTLCPWWCWEGIGNVSTRSVECVQPVGNLNTLYNLWYFTTTWGMVLGASMSSQATLWL